VLWPLLAFEHFIFGPRRKIRASSVSLAALPATKIGKKKWRRPDLNPLIGDAPTFIRFECDVPFLENLFNEMRFGRRRVICGRRLVKHDADVFRLFWGRDFDFSAARVVLFFLFTEEPVGRGECTVFSRHRFNSGPSTGKWMASKEGS
jgi:hypothetical protein